MESRGKDHAKSSDLRPCGFNSRFAFSESRYNESTSFNKPRTITAMNSGWAVGGGLELIDSEQFTTVLYSVPAVSSMQTQT